MNCAPAGDANQPFALTIGRSQHGADECDVAALTAQLAAGLCLDPDKSHLLLPAHHSEPSGAPAAPTSSRLQLQPGLDRVSPEFRAAQAASGGVNGAGLEEQRQEARGDEDDDCARVCACLDGSMSLERQRSEVSG
jgi:hypothetical protein